MIGVVLDTNVVISALLKENGLEATVLDLAFAGDLRLSASEAILEEYRLTLARPKFRGIGLLHIERSEAALRHIAQLVEPSRVLSVSPHETDNRFLECAEASNADFLITGNKRHFPDHWKRTRVVNAREFLGHIGQHTA